MEELKGEEIIGISITQYGEFVITATNNRTYYTNWDVLYRALRKCNFIARKKRTRTHLIEVAR